MLTYNLKYKPHQCLSIDAIIKSTDVLPKLKYVTDQYILMNSRINSTYFYL